MQVLLDTTWRAGIGLAEPLFRISKMVRNGFEPHWIRYD